MFDLGLGVGVLFRHIGAGQVRKRQHGRNPGKAAQTFQKRGQILGGKTQTVHAGFTLDGHAQGAVRRTAGRRFFNILKVRQQGGQVQGHGGLPVFRADGPQQRHDSLTQPGLAQGRAFAHRAHGEAPGPGLIQGAGHGQQTVTVGVGFDDRHDGGGIAQTGEIAPQGGEINMAT